MESTGQATSSGSIPPAKPKELHDLPREMRQRIIDFMSPKTMCLFAQVSHSCREDVKASKHWVYSLSFEKSVEMLTISVKHKDRHAVDEEKKLSYKLEFSHGRRCKIVRCFSNEGRPLWRQNLSNGLNLVEHASKMFREMLEKFQRSLKKLSIDGWNDGSLKPQLEMLTNFKQFSISNVFNLEDVLVDFRKPLDSLVLDSINPDQDITDFEQVYQTKMHLLTTKANFDIVKLRKMSATRITTNIGALTPKDLFEVVNRWKDNTWSTDPQFYEFKLQNSTFDRKEMLDLFGKEGLNPYMGVFEIRHKFDAQKKTTCCYDFSHVLLDFANLLPT